MLRNLNLSLTRQQFITSIFVISLTVLVTILMLLNNEIWNYFVSLFLIISLAAISLRLIQMLPDGVDFRIERRAFWIGLFLRIFFAFAFHGLLTLVNFRGVSGYYFDDENYYFQLGSSAATSLSYGRNVLAGLEWNYVRHLGNVPFVYLIAVLFSAFGKDMLIIRLWMSLAGALVIPLTYRTSMIMLRDERLARRIMWITTIFPTLVLWSAAPLREILVVFLMILGTYLSLSPLPFPIRLSGGIFVIILTGALRFVAGIAVGCVLLAAILFRNKNHSMLGALFKLFLLAFFFITLQFVAQNEPNLTLSFENSLERYTNVATDRRAQNSAIQNNTLFGDFLRSLRILLLPHPFASFGNDFPASIIGIIEGTVWFILLPGIVSGYVVIFRKIKLRHYVLFILPVIITIYSGTEAGSTWEPQRARLIVYPFIIMCAVVGWQAVKDNLYQVRTNGKNTISFVLITAHGIIALELLLVLGSGLSQIFNISLFGSHTLLLVICILFLMTTLIFAIRYIRRN